MVNPTPSGPSRSTRRALAPLVAGALCAVLTACGSTETSTTSTTAAPAGTVAPTGATSTTSTTATTSAPATSTTKAAGATSTTKATGATTSTTATTASSLVLEADGLGAVSFGDPATEVLAALSKELGEPEDDDTLSECGGGADRGVRWADLSVSFMGGNLVGYHYGSPSGDVTHQISTIEGISAGSTVGQLKAAYPTVEVTESSLGPEWTVPDGVNGFLSSMGPAATVTGVYAGDNCFAR